MEEINQIQQQEAEEAGEEEKATRNQLEHDFRFELTGSFPSGFSTPWEGTGDSSEAFSRHMGEIRYTTACKFRTSTRNARIKLLELRLTLSGSREPPLIPGHLLAALASFIDHLYSSIDSFPRIKTSSLIHALNSLRLQEEDIPGLETLQPLFAELFHNSGNSSFSSSIYLLWLALFSLKGCPKLFVSMAHQAMRKLKKLGCVKHDRRLQEVTRLTQYDKLEFVLFDYRKKPKSRKLKRGVKGGKRQERKAKWGEKSLRVGGGGGSRTGSRKERGNREKSKIGGKVVGGGGRSGKKLGVAMSRQGLSYFTKKSGGMTAKKRQKSQKVAKKINFSSSFRPQKKSRPTSSKVKKRPGDRSVRPPSARSRKKSAKKKNRPTSSKTKNRGVDRSKSRPTSSRPSERAWGNPKNRWEGPKLHYSAKKKSGRNSSPRASKGAKKRYMRPDTSFQGLLNRSRYQKMSYSGNSRPERNLKTEESEEPSEPKMASKMTESK